MKFEGYYLRIMDNRDIIRTIPGTEPIVATGTAGTITFAAMGGGREWAVREERM